MELRMSGVGPGPVMVPNPTAQQTTASRATDAPKSAPALAPVVLVSLFDRNGDGKIDDTTWVDGGDAFVSVGKDVAAILSRPAPDVAATRPVPAPPASTAVTSGLGSASGRSTGSTEAAASAYLHYGAA